MTAYEEGLVPIESLELPKKDVHFRGKDLENIFCKQTMVYEFLRDTIIISQRRINMVLSNMGKDFFYF